MELRRRDRVKDGCREVLRDVGRSMLRIRHEHPQPSARGDVADDGEKTHPGQQGRDVAIHDFELRNFDFTREPNAMPPIRMLLEKDAVAVCDALDMACQFFHLTLLIAGEPYRMYCLHVSIPGVLAGAFEC
jgi:hypothetical protein